MPLDNNHSFKKHGQDFLQCLNIQSLDDYVWWSENWQTLNKVKRKAKWSVADFIDKITDGIDERRAAEIEAAADNISLLVAEIDAELDYRNEIGNRSPRDGSLKYMKAPVVLPFLQH